MPAFQAGDKSSILLRRTENISEVHFRLKCYTCVIFDIYLHAWTVRHM
jgi:hypothetical protein